MGEAMAFWSVLLPPNGKDVQQEVESTETVLTSIHITGAALGVSPKQGPHVIVLEYNGVNTVVATLESPSTRQCRLDVVVDQTVKMRVIGPSEVHLYGYQISTLARSEDSDDDDEEDEYPVGSDDEEDEEEDEGYEESDEEDYDDERTPRAVPLYKALKKHAAAAAAASPNGDAMDTDEEDADDEGDSDAGESDEDEEGEEDEDEEIPSPASSDLVYEAADPDEDEQEEEELRPAGKVGAKRAPQTPQPGKPAKQAKQEPPKSAPPKQQQQKQAQKAQQHAGAKQIPVKAADKPVAVKVEGAGKEASKGPAKKDAKEPKQEAKAAQPGKKEGKEQKPAKQDGKEAKAKEQQPQAGKQAKATKDPANEAEYRQALVDFLKGQKGPVALTQIGNAIKRPPGVAKLGAYLKDHTDTFVVASGSVSLKK